MAKHHFIPKCYLRYFSIPNKEGYICVYQAGKKPFVTQVGNIAAEKDFYTFTDPRTGEKNDILEKAFSKLEGLVAPILEDVILANEFKLEDEQRVHLSEFLALLHLRGRKYRETAKRFYEEFVKEQMANIAANRECLAQNAKEAGLELDDEELEAIREMAEQKRYLVDFKDEDYFILQIVELYPDLAELVFCKRWIVLETCCERPFITSDNPVALMRTPDIPKYWGVGFLTGIIKFPLSPRRCLLIDNEDREEGIVEIGPEHAEFINKHTAFFSNDYVYSNVESEDIQCLLEEVRQKKK